MRYIYSPAALLLVFVVSSLQAQQTNPLKYSINQSTAAGERPKNYWIVEPPSQSIKSSKDSVRIIVRFKSNPIGKSSDVGRQSARASLETEHQQFINDLQKIEKRSSSGRAGAASELKILFDYREVFNGFALVTTRAIKDEIKNLSYISYVVEDKQVQVSDFQSSQIINAPTVWSELNITGKGITIGIIDTGIDYNHPDLGGGFGPGFKVKGGYDFVNNDRYPFDDNGHGTHVAGIAAANGTGLKGVAPDANLIAYKVLAAEGYGYDSWILAAIERTVDPDQNPNTQDALDVVNMSLGRQVDASEPLSEAVNNAVAQGVIYVIAAGNNYDYLTVGTPGIAEKAITVAATDRYDYTAYFSSKGPVEGSFVLKPDVAAPGVDIYSSFKNGGYSILSGTSMASPHVAGAVALLLEKHPDWTPEMVKAALMNTAKKSNEPIWNQGAGRIDVYKAITADFIFTPGSISLGVAPETSPYVKTIKAKVSNQSNTTKSFSFSLEGDLNNAAISVAFNPTSLLLNPNSSQDVDITFTINTSTLPVQNLPDAITGYIATNSGSQSIKTPVTLVNPQITKLKFDGELPLNVIVFGVNAGNYFWKPYFPTTDQLDLFLPNGTYDIISMYSKNHTVVSEAVDANANSRISLSKNLAKNRLIFKPLDKFGNAIPITGTTFGDAIFSGTGKNFLTFYPYAEDTFYISDQSAYRYDIRMRDKSGFDAEHTYDINVSTEYGIFQSGIYSNNPSSFGELNIFNPSAGPNQGIINYDRAGVPNSYFMVWNTYPTTIQNPLNLLISGTDPTSLMMGSLARLSPLNQEIGYSWETSVWKTGDDSHVTLADKAFLPIAELPPSFDYRLGETLVHYSAQTENRGDKIILLDIQATGIFNRKYGERECGTVYFKLFAGDDLIREGNFANSTNQTGGSLQLDALPRQYKMMLTYEDYQVHGKFGKATAKLDFNTSYNDKNTPHLNYLSLDVDGKSTSQFQIGDHATIIAKIDDTCMNHMTSEGCASTGIASVLMYLKKNGTDNWINLDITQLPSNEYHAQLPTTLDEGYYTVKLIAKDFSENILTYELNPGFLIGRATESIPYANVNLIEPADKSINSGTNPLFRWSSFPVASYIIQISDTIDFTSVIVEANVNDATYNLPSPLKKNKLYYWRVKANYAGNSIPWSAIYSFYSDVLGGTTLLNPIQDAVEQPFSIQFQWSKVDKASSYWIQLYKADFSELIFQSYTYDTSVVVDNLLPNTEYYWSVLTNYFTSSNSYNIPSPVSYFKTITLKSATLIQPIHNAINQPLNAQFKWSKVNLASSYNFQLSSKEDFSEIQFQGVLFDTTIAVNGLAPNTQYFWNVTTSQLVDEKPYDIPSVTNYFKTLNVTGVDDIEIKREAYNYPNPFSSNTNVIFQADKPGVATLVIFDPLGQEVNRINIKHGSGKNSIVWNGENKDANVLTNGLYIGILETEAGLSYLKMIIKR